MKYICTYFDINFLSRGLALLDSIEKNSDAFMLYILALDKETEAYFTELDNKNIKIISLTEYIEYFNIDRSKYKNEKEFYFSITPSLCLCVLENYNEIDILLYLDADVCLFNKIELLYEEIGSSSIAICSQRLPWYNSKKYGIYNVGVNAFRNDEEGIKCLQQWHHDCSTWEENQVGYSLSFFSDQIWLDQWPKLYDNLKIIEHKGIDTAPWNAYQYKFSKRENQFYVDEMPLVIYHFSSLSKLSNGTWHGNTALTILDIQDILLEIYERYIKMIIEYDLNKRDNGVELKFNGNKLKMVIQIILKKFHNHIIKVER